MIYTTAVKFNVEYSDMYNTIVLNTLPLSHRPLFISQSILNKLKGDIYIKRAVEFMISFNSS